MGSWRSFHGYGWDPVRQDVVIGENELNKCKRLSSAMEKDGETGRKRRVSWWLKHRKQLNKWRAVQEYWCDRDATVCYLYLPSEKIRIDRPWLITPQKKAASNCGMNTFLVFPKDLHFSAADGEA